MAENLGALLHQHEANHMRRLEEAEDRKRKEEEARNQDCHNRATAWLAKLREKIPQDAKNGYCWSADDGGMTYVVPSGGERIAQLVRQRKLPNSDWRTEYVLWNGAIWDEFVTWAKEHGLTAELCEKSHSEYRGDEGWSEHDYYYILLCPLE